MITELAGAGVGLMWGWLAGLVLGRARRRLRSSLALGAATALVTAGVVSVANRQSVVCFLGCTVLALVLNLLWLMRLRSRLSITAGD